MVFLNDKVFFESHWIYTYPHGNEQIWKRSRLQFIPKETKPPPDGMNEEKYAKLLIAKRRCQICKRSKECKIYCAFEIRCCDSCFSNNTVS